VRYTRVDLTNSSHTYISTERGREPRPRPSSATAWPRRATRRGFLFP